jgi:hypothetical protein
MKSEFPYLARCKDIIPVERYGVLERPGIKGYTADEGLVLSILTSPAGELLAEHNPITKRTTYMRLESIDWWTISEQWLSNGDEDE